MRLRRAREAIHWAPTLSSPMTGRKMAACRAVNATRVPMEMPPEVSGKPAAR